MGLRGLSFVLIALIVSLVLIVMIRARPAVVPDADRLMKEGETYFKASAFDSARARYDRAADLYRIQAQRLQALEAGFQSAECFRKKGLADQAAANFETIMDSAVQIQSDPLVASCLNKLGLIELLKGRHEKAFQHFERALTIRLRVLPPNHIDIAWTYNNIGLTYNHQDRYADAVVQYEKATAIMRKYPDQRHALALTLNNMGTSLQDLGRVKAAGAAYEEALGLALRGKDRSDQTISYLYSNIASLYRSQGDPEQATAYYEKALRFQQETIGADHPEIAISYYNLGLIAQDLGHTQAAETYLRQALSVWNRYYPDGHPYIARCHDELGRLFLERNLYDSARTHFQNSLAQWNASRNDGRLRFVYRHLGYTYDRMGDRRTGLEFLEKALHSAQEFLGEAHSETMQGYLDLADHALASRDAATALRWYQKALGSDSSVRSYEPFKCVLAYEGMARCYEIFLSGSHSRTDLERAVSAYGSALGYSETARRLMTTESAKLRFGQTIRSIYGQALQLTLIMYQKSPSPQVLERAFDLMERSKAFRMREILSDRRSRIAPGIPDSLTEAESRLQDQILSARHRLWEDQRKGSANEQTIVRRRDALFDLEERYRRHIAFIRQSYPAYFDLRFQSGTVPLTDMKSKLRSDAMTLIEYFFGKDRIILLASADQNDTLMAIPIDSTLRRAIANMQSLRSGPANDSMIQAAALLYDHLIRPAIPSPGTRLLVIPDGELSYIPFEALLTDYPRPVGYSNLPYLIRRTAVTYAFSSTVYLFATQQNPQAERNKILGVAPSVFQFPYQK